MTRHFKPIFGSAILLALFACACGGPAATGSGETEPSASKGGADAPKDAQAEAAQTFCDHEVKASELQPPDALNRKQIAACMTGIRPRIEAECAKGAPRDIVVKFIIDKSGAVIEAFPIGDGADSPEASCAAGIVKGVRFPKFKASLQQVIPKYPISIGK